MNKPCISSQIEVFPRNDGSAEIFNKVNKKSYSIGRNEYNVLQNLNGIRTPEELSEISGIYTADMVCNLIAKFEKIGMIKGKEVKVKFNVLRIKKGIMNPNRILSRDNVLVKIIYFCIVYLSLPLFAAGLWSSRDQFGIILQNAGNSILTPSFLLILPISFLVLALHELAHAVVARYNNVNVAEFGIMLYWFMPCAYTNLNGIAFVTKKSTKLLILTAGILSNLGISGLGFLLLPLVSGRLYDLLLWFAASNVVITFTNLLVFLKFDGYFILEEFMGVKNLRENSFAFVRRRNRKLDYSSEVFDGEKLDKSMDKEYLNNLVYWLYGVFSITYMPILIASVVLLIINLIQR
jgi:putative peptide zinc metalloprotease protein